MTLDDLEAYGANTQEGLQRCMGVKSLYLRLVESIKTEDRFDRLAQAIDEGRLSDAFDAAHALKGVLGNLSLTPLQRPMEEITELLRNQTPADYKTLVEQILTERDRFRALS